MCNYFEFEVTVCEEHEEGLNAGKYGNVKYCGVVCASSYPEAIESVIASFGKEYINSITLSEWDVGDACLVMTKQCLAELREDDPYADKEWVDEN